LRLRVLALLHLLPQLARPFLDLLLQQAGSLFLGPDALRDVGVGFDESTVRHRVEGDLDNRAVRPAPLEPLAAARAAVQFAGRSPLADLEPRAIAEPALKGIAGIPMGLDAPLHPGFGVAVQHGDAAPPHRLPR